MTRVRVAAATLNQTPLDWDGNQRNILAAIAQARAAGVQFLCLPELSITGYGCEDTFHSLGLQRLSLDMLDEIAAATKGLVVSVGLPLMHHSALFDTACLLVDRRIVGFVAKRYLAGEGLHYEPRWFKPWPRGLRDHVSVRGQSYPIGDLVFDCGGIKLGFEICEDAWVAQRPGSEMSLQAVDIIFNPSASHFAFGKFEVRKRFVIEGSRAFSVSYVYANLVGNEAGRVIYDGGGLIASAGRLLAQGPRFSFAPFGLTTAVIDVGATRMNLARTGSFQPDLTPHGESIVRVDFPCRDLDPEIIRPAPPAWEQGNTVKEEEFTRAVALGLFDYMRKSRSRGFVVNLSGGVDSSATACLVAMMLRLAADELGESALSETLAYIPGFAELADHRQRVARLLHCIYQATRNSSHTTRDAACAVADAIGASMSCLAIDDLVTRYVAGAEEVLGRPLTWSTDDLALQNIQARVRAPSAWLVANVKGALLLATSNRSEAAVGYATMDGDTAGGLSPIAGIDKAYLRRWLHWLQTEGPAGLGPIPALAAVNAIPPTAELRPPASGQTDEGDLMPYDVLDVIERMAIRDKQTPLETFRLVRAQFDQYSAAELHVWVRRFFLLWSRNQWKRERFAPAFHLDDENLDPKTWCRFPILSGGFTRELAELDAYVNQEPSTNDRGSPKHECQSSNDE